ncbi:MAG TPA: cation:proton antiporter [Ktedonobacterales bacterium]
MDNVTLWFVILAFVLTAAALSSGVVDRAPLSLPVIFLALGLVLGPGVTGVIQIGPHNPALTAVATLNLALVLFLDAARFDVDELRREWRVPLLDLGPGTLLTIAGIALTAALLLRTDLLQSLLLGAILASTDPIVLRDVVRNEHVPRSVRRTLTIEAGTNDVIVLPIVLIAIRIAVGVGGGAGPMIGFLLRLLILSPLVGLVVGGVGAWLMGKADALYSIRREYQALYGIGLVLASYAAAQAVGGDGFLAAFFAGLAVTIFDITLCDCFMEYGDVTSEVAMLLGFILFGAVLGPLFGTIPFGIALLFAVIVIIVVRPLALSTALLRAKMSPIARIFIAWFGPRGLSALLLALLAVGAGMPHATQLLAITGVVVLVSVLVHGVTATPAANWYGRRISQNPVVLPEERESGAGGLFEEDAASIPRVSVEELHAMLAGPNPPVVLDVRTRGQYAASPGRIPGSVRVLPDKVREWAATAKKDRAVVAYCT